MGFEVSSRLDKTKIYDLSRELKESFLLRILSSNKIRVFVSCTNKNYVGPIIGFDEDKIVFSKNKFCTYEKLIKISCFVKDIAHFLDDLYSNNKYLSDFEKKINKQPISGKNKKFYIDYIDSRSSRVIETYFSSILDGFLSTEDRNKEILTFYSKVHLSGFSFFNIISNKVFSKMNYPIEKVDLEKWSKDWNDFIYPELLDNIKAQKDNKDIAYKVELLLRNGRYISGFIDEEDLDNKIVSIHRYIVDRNPVYIYGHSISDIMDISKYYLEKKITDAG